MSWRVVRRTGRLGRGKIFFAIKRTRRLRNWMRMIIFEKSIVRSENDILETTTNYRTRSLTCLCSNSGCELSPSAETPRPFRPNQNFRKLPLTLAISPEGTSTYPCKPALICSAKDKMILIKTVQVNHQVITQKKLTTSSIWSSGLIFRFNPLFSLVTIKSR